MKIFEIIANAVVMLSLVYVCFGLTLADWLAGLRKGQAVSLLPERNGRNYPIWAQVGLVGLGLAIFAAMAWLLWIPLLFLPNLTIPGCAWVDPLRSRLYFHVVGSPFAWENVGNQYQPAGQTLR